MTCVACMGIVSLAGLGRFVSIVCCISSTLNAILNVKFKIGRALYMECSISLYKEINMIY